MKNKVRIEKENIMTELIVISKMGIVYISLTSAMISFAVTAIVMWRLR